MSSLFMWHPLRTAPLSLLWALLSPRADLALAALALFCTSVLYWRRPRRGGRRRADMLCAGAALALHALAGGAAYRLCVLAALGCYARARREPDQRRAWAWHCAMHVVGFLANFTLLTSST